MTFPGSGLIIEPLEAGDANSKHEIGRQKEIGIIHAVVLFEKGSKL